MDQDTLEAMVAELAPLIGARVQRVDVVDEGEIVLEARVPGRTLHLLIATRSGVDRVLLVPKRPPKRVEPGSFQALLRRRLEGRPLTELAADRRTFVLAVPGTKILARLGAGISVEMPEELPPKQPVFTEIPATFPLSEKLAAELEPRVAGDLATRLRRHLLAPIEASLKKTKRLLQKLEQDRRNLESLAASRSEGELLKTVLGKMKRGDKSVEVVDWSTGETKTVALDPMLDPKANLERLFRRAKKADRGLPVVDARLASTAARIAQLEAERARIKNASLDELANEAPDRPERAEQERPKTTQPTRAGAERWARRFTSADGHEIYVGKGAKENDRLTFSVAKGHDLWLHARGVPGAHVLLRLSKGEAPPQEALLDAAHLAVHYSGAKSEAKAEVIYTEARYVKKTKGAAPGAVGLSKEKTMLLRVEASRLERLLA